MFSLKTKQGEEGESCSVRVKFDKGKPNVIYVKKLTSGTAKAQLLLDILCLHRYVHVYITVCCCGQACHYTSLYCHSN